MALEALVYLFFGVAGASAIVLMILEAMAWTEPFDPWANADD